MTIETLKDRITKAQDRITKKEATIVKKQGNIEKYTEKLATKYGIEDVTSVDPRTLEYEAWDLVCKIKWLQDDLVRLPKEVEEIKNTLEKYNLQLAGEVEKEEHFLREIPESMKAMQDELVTRWDAWDIEHRDKVREDKKVMDYKEFCKKYNPTERFDLIYKSNEDIHKANMRDSKQYILSLYYRVKAITGEVTDWSGIRCVGVALNGLVIGKEGRAEVETILAGGYNIQRLHCRTLVHDRH